MAQVFSSSYITCLNIGYCLLTDQSVTDLTSIIKNSLLNSLDLSGNKFTLQGIKILSKVF